MVSAFVMIVFFYIIIYGLYHAFRLFFKHPGKVMSVIFTTIWIILFLPILLPVCIIGAFIELITEFLPEHNKFRLKFEKFKNKIEEKSKSPTLNSLK